VNIALPALVVLLGILPGITFFYTYFAGRFDKRQAGVGGAEELALYIVFAVPIDAAGLWLCRVFGIDLNFSITAQLLSGTLSDIAAIELATIFRQNAYLTAVTYAVILLGASIAGSIVRRFVWASRLDTRLPYLRLHNDWFYVLHGRQSHLPREVVTFVDVLTTHPDGSRLYKGAVVHFEVGASGTLQTLTLIYPQRGKGRGARLSMG
jgi:hypothetical protein